MNFIMKLILFTNIYHSILSASKQKEKMIPRNESGNMLAAILTINRSPTPQTTSDEFHTPIQSPTHSSSKIIPTQSPARLQTQSTQEFSDWDNCLDGVFNAYQRRTNSGHVNIYMPVQKK